MRKVRRLREELDADRRAPLDVQPRLCGLSVRLAHPSVRHQKAGSPRPATPMEMRKKRIPQNPDRMSPDFSVAACALSTAHAVAPPAPSRRPFALLQLRGVELLQGGVEHGLHLPAHGFAADQPCAPGEGHVQRDGDQRRKILRAVGRNQADAAVSAQVQRNVVAGNVLRRLFAENLHLRAIRLHVLPEAGDAFELIDIHLLPDQILQRNPMA